jgi:hypothetical protein
MREWLIMDYLQIFTRCGPCLIGGVYCTSLSCEHVHQPDHPTIVCVQALAASACCLMKVGNMSASIARWNEVRPLSTFCNSNPPPVAINI